MCYVIFRLGRQFKSIVASIRAHSLFFRSPAHSRLTFCIATAQHIAGTVLLPATGSKQYCRLLLLNVKVITMFDI